MANAGTVEVNFAAETAKFTAELKKVQASLGKLEQNFVAIEKVARGALRFLAPVALLSFAKSSLAAADALGDAAERAGIAVESFSRLQFAASQTDVEMSALVTGIQKFQVTLSKASTGSEAAEEVLARFGVTAQSLANLSVEDQLSEIAEAFRRVRDPADRTRLAVELFGKSAGPQLVPLLARGKEGIRELAAEADRLGITLDTRAVGGIDRAAKALERLKLATSRGFSNIVGSFLANTFGSGDEIADIEARVASLTVRRDQLLTVPNSFSEQGLAAELKKINDELATLDIRLKGLRFAEIGGTNSLMNLLPLPWIKAVQEIDLTAIQALKINVDELAEAFRRLNQSVAEIQQARVTEALRISTADVQDLQRTLQQSITADVEQELQRRSAMEQFYRDQRVAQEFAAEQAISNLKQAAFANGIAALQAFAGNSKKVAIALVAIQKARALAEAVQLAHVSIMQAAASAPPPLNAGAILAAKAFAALNIAAIAATGFGQIRSIQAGGAPIGSVANPAFTQSGETDQQQFGASPQKVTQIVFAGPVFNNRETRDAIVETIQEAVDDDVIVIAPNSLNGQALLEGGA